MKSVQNIKDLNGKKVLVRVDFNLPIKNGKVEDDFRIQKAIPTISFLQKKGAKVILISHLGKGGESLSVVAKSLKKYIKAQFVPDIIGPKAKEAVDNLKNGEVILLENLRNDPGEQGRNEVFALNLSSFADVYVNEAFPVSHREDASIVMLPKLLPGYTGLQLEAEIQNLSVAFKKPKHPFLFILGGAKFSTKMPLIKKYLRSADTVFIGGALLNDLLKVKGYEVGKSLIDEGDYGIESIIKNKKIIWPEDVVVLSGKKQITKLVTEVSKDDYILDIGEKSIKKLESVIKKSKLVLWNGPLGKYESGGGASTKKILKAVAASKAISVIGGGDTVELISELKMEKKFSFVSTGGGATLDFLANGTLPGIKVLK